MELYYRRQETTHKGKAVTARVETVVIYVPDVWNCLPTQLEWDGLQVNYKKLLTAKMNKAEPAPPAAAAAEDEKANYFSLYSLLFLLLTCMRVSCASFKRLGCS